MRRIVSTITALLLAVLALGVTAQPAQAATYIKICIMAGSVDPLYVYNTSVNFEAWIYPPAGSTGANCDVDIRDDNGGARVDVDPGGVGGDVDSWNKKGSGSGGNWGPCYNNEDGGSNPYSGAGAYTTYKTWAGLNCH